ncbi:hypothetical protein LDENG_00120320 [Lucifuga dentata]|nr:hypothetical protein LDENG_00120320 [Lucifuga dentata]
MVVGQSPEDEELIRALAIAVQKPLRKLFTLLSLDSTQAKIHELGNPKAKKSDVPLFVEVTEQAKVLLDAGEEIPCDLMAKVLKFQLLQIKANDQRRRAAEKAEEEKAKNQAGSASKDKGGAKVSDKKAKSPFSAEGPSKEKTTLKRRGEVEPPTFIDDEPDDGPQHYVLLLGFYQPRLVSALDAIGVHVANVIKVCSDHTHTSEGQQQEQHTPEGNQQSQRASLALEAEGEIPRDLQLAAQIRKLMFFWSGLRPVLDSAPLDSKLHDTAQLIYTVSPQPLPFHMLDPDAVLALGSDIFEGVACLIYDCLDWRRQHQHYLNNIKFTPLPVTPGSKKKLLREDSQLPPCKETDVDMRYYSNLLALVPPEACSVPIILHCMLEQVVISTEQSASPPSIVAEESRPPDAPWLDHQLLSHMLETFLPLVHTKEERTNMLNSLLTPVQNEKDKTRLVEKFGLEETPKTAERPLVFRHHDKRALRLREVAACQGFDPAEAESSMMKSSPIWQLIRSAVQQRNSDTCWLTMKQQLQHYFTDGHTDGLSWPQVEHLFHQSVFESMPLTAVDQQGLLQNATNPLGTLAQQQTPSVIPWDNPLSYAKQELRNQQSEGQTFLTEDSAQLEQTSRGVCRPLDLFDIQSCRQRSLFDWHYAEQHDATIFPQVLQEASEEYCCLDTFRGSLNNILYIFCHNPMSPHLQCKESWDTALHTDVRFRNYLDHVADTISGWTKEEETKREAMQLKHFSPAESPKGDGATESGTEHTMEPVIRKDSLKAWKMEQDRLKEEEAAKKSKRENSHQGKQQKEEGGSAKNKKDKNKPVSGGKKSTEETTESSSMSPTQSVAAIAPPVEETTELQPTEEPCKPFTGYSMDSKLIQVSGHIQHLLPSDGGHITVENISYVEGSSLMKVCVTKDGHHFYTHINHLIDKQRNRETINNETNDKTVEKKGKNPEEIKIVKQGSFSAVLDNGVHLSYSFYGPTGQYTGVTLGTDNIQQFEVNPQVVEGEVTETESVSTSHLVPLTSSAHGSNISAPSETHAQGKQTHTYNIQVHAKPEMYEDHPALPSHPFNSLNLSVPNGLVLQFLQEDSQSVSPKEQNILVRQSFPLHGTGEVGQVWDASLSRELSRTITSQGAVVRYMRDGSTEVLFADGSVSISQDSGPVWVPDSEVEVEITPQEAQDNIKEGSSKKDAVVKRGCWLTTAPSGARICTFGTTHQHIPTAPLLVFKATDPITHHVMLSREDLVVSVQNTDGSQSVEHADGTRITSLYQDRPANISPHVLLHTGERPESFECMCGFTECVCVTRCAQSVHESNLKPQTQNICGSGEEINMDNSCEEEEEGAEHARTNLSACENGEASVYKNSEESAFAEETVGENSERSACESGKVSVSAKEWVLLVEKEGCVTVVMYPERHAAHVFLADGTIITGDNHGAYQVFASGEGCLHIQSDGKCVYLSEPPVTPSPKDGTLRSQPGSYSMSHTDKVACDFTDPDGNHYQVMEDGQIFSHAGSTSEDEEEEEEDREIAKIHIQHREHCPRLFLLREDGSGTELLSSETVEELLYQAYSDPTTALLKEPLPDTQDEFGIAILKPSHPSVWSQWVLAKQNPDITPPNLRNRSWHDFPRVEKTPGPPFGSDLGHGLDLTTRSSSSPELSQIQSCPEVLEMRELHQHRAFTTQLKNYVDTRLKEYIESLMEREQQLEEMKIKDPRTEEEGVHATDLLRLVLSFSEAEDGGHATDKRTSVDVVSLYSQGVRASFEQSGVSEDTTIAADDSLNKESKWTERLAQYREELCEEKASREALRKKIVVPYFHLENMPLYQSLFQYETPDMKSLSMALPPITKSDNAETFLKDAPQENTPRPLNPTPSHAASHAAGSDMMPVKRPTNPTPQSAGECSLRGSSGQCQSVQLDVTGKPRQTTVRLPTSILSSKPPTVPNHQFLSVEDPVRRRCRTISLIDPNTVVRGFQLLPSSVDFGTVREGTAWAVNVMMKNVGVDTCRFHVKQPPPATGLRVIYNPGPVAAGLQVELQVRLFAMCAVQVQEKEPKNYIFQDILIHSETDILYLPVTANILLT